MKHSDEILGWLKNEGYSHCFFVPGGNIMHLVDSASKIFQCVPFVHEVSATIATEYFNEAKFEPNSRKAFTLVTAGPGITNAVTGIAGAWLESRELLVLGGQVKTTDINASAIRQNGIQEIDGVELVRSLTKYAHRALEPITENNFKQMVRLTQEGRKGPVFIEFPIDIQSRPAGEQRGQAPVIESINEKNLDPDKESIREVAEALRESQRPVLLVGGGYPRLNRGNLSEITRKIGIPVMTTWNGADRYDSRSDLYWGRPNTWGQRYSNLLLQQADMVIALGTRLGLQQTGFEWSQFAPLAKVVQVDIDEAELSNSHPHKDWAVKADATEFLDVLATFFSAPLELEEWLYFGKELKHYLPLSEKSNQKNAGYLNSFDFILLISELIPDGSFLTPSSSGGSLTCTMQALNQKNSQVIISNKGLASMGYGLAGSIGMALASDNKLTVLIEGDGGFSQNLQELGTVASNNLNLKIFVFSNGGYASIKMTQKNYFDGNFVGVDRASGLGLPNLRQLADTYGIPYRKIGNNVEEARSQLPEILSLDGPVISEVPLDPEQTYFPKIGSTIDSKGVMRSSPLHEMQPPLDEAVSIFATRYLTRERPNT